jgi:hypothetical protein
MEYGVGVRIVRADRRDEGKPLRWIRSRSPRAFLRDQSGMARQARART